MPGPPNLARSEKPFPVRRPIFAGEILQNMNVKLSTREDYLQRIGRVREYVAAHLDENLDLEALAALSGFSPWHFHRIVGAFLGEPLGAFVTRLRVEKAARLLRYSAQSVSQIAYAVGYGTPSSLSKVFRRFYGISPTQYRNRKDHVIMKPVELRPELSVEARVESLNEKTVLYVSLSGEYGSLDFPGAWGRLWAYVRRHGLAPCVQEHLCVYHDDPKVTEQERLRTDVCLSLESDPRSGLRPDARPEGGIGIKTIAGGRYAVFRYRGPYADLGAVYDTIYGRWIPERGWTLRDAPAFENYLNHPDRTPPGELLTEICVPVE